jgi:uncharacterized membrane protein SpoIIM required for sporulation
MFYAQYKALWWIVAALLVVNIILVRMGLRLFNREEILSKELDEISLKHMLRDFKGYFLRPPELAGKRTNHDARFNLLRFYRHDIPLLLKEQMLPFAVVLIVTVGAIIIGIDFARQFPIPPEVFPLAHISGETFKNVQQLQLLPEIDTSFIFFNNLRVMLLGGLISFFSFGALTLFLVLINGGLVSFLIAEVIQMGYNPWLFVAAFVLPHGILEIPAILIGLTFALRIGAGMISPPAGLDIGQGILLTVANFVKILIFLVIPLLLVAAFIEANITPQIVLAMYAGG